LNRGRTVRLISSADGALRLAAAAEWIDSYPKDAELVVLAPSKEAGDEIVRSSAIRSRARFGLQRATLDQLASRLAAVALAQREIAPATRLSMEAVCARAVYLLSSEGGLDYFGGVASKPGFPIALARTFEEFRMSRLEVDRLKGLSRGGADLARLIARVELELDDAGLADRAAKFEAAIASAAAIDAPHPVGLPLLVLDVQITSVLEAELISILARQSHDALVTIPTGDEASVRHLKRVLETPAEETRPDHTGCSLDNLKRHLFRGDAPPSSELDDSVVLNSFPGESRESTEVARAIQQEAARGVAFDRMAVLLRAPNEYRTHLQEAFRRAGIPSYFARGTRRPHPTGRAFLALLACAADGLSARRFSEYLSLAQVPDKAGTEALSQDDKYWEPPESDLLPEVLINELQSASESSSDKPALEPDVAAGTSSSTHDDGRSVRAPWRWEQLLVDSAVIGGQDRWRRRLDGLETELRLKRKELIDEQEETRLALVDQQIDQLQSLKEFALPLIDRLASLPQQGTWGEWLVKLRELASLSLREPEEVLSTLTELEPMSPVGPVDLYEVQLVLSPRLRELAIRPPRLRYGSVFVGSTEAARGMTFDVVFVPGVAEKLFPRKIIEDPILLDESRKALTESVPLTTQADRVISERLALRLAIGAARQRVYISYPRIDVQQARPRVPSFYALEVLRAAEGRLSGFDELSRRAESSTSARLGWPAPLRPEDAIDEAEYDLALLAPLREEDPEATTGAAHYLLSANPHLTRALRFRARRWLRRWTIADGLVDPDEFARAALARHQISQRSFSPTALQNFAACPYKFFLQAIHRLQPRQEPIAIEVLDPLTRGSLFHEAQFEVLTLLRSRHSLPVTAANLKEATEAVDKTLDRVAMRYFDELAPAIPRVWDDAMSLIRADLREWLRRMAEDREGWVPDRFELSFGLSDRDRPNEDPASVEDPIPVAGGLKLRGSIDLVERHPSGKLRATDHKTGKVRARTDFVVEGGKVLQPIFYALALEHLLNAPVDSGRLYYCTSDGGYAERIVKVDEFSRSVGETVVQIIGNALEAGFLPAAPDKRACDWCDYRLVCGPREEIRTARKPKDRLDELQQLRELR
jgi:ATP-dependent helicase/nuclease subunit B